MAMLPHVNIHGRQYRHATFEKGTSLSYSIRRSDSGLQPLVTSESEAAGEQIRPLGLLMNGCLAIAHSPDAILLTLSNQQCTHWLQKLTKFFM